MSVPTIPGNPFADLLAERSRREAVSLDALAVMALAFEQHQHQRNRLAALTTAGRGRLSLLDDPELAAEK